MRVTSTGAMIALVLLASGAAQADIADASDPANNYGSDIVISIFNTATSQSALIDTNINMTALAANPAAFDGFTFSDTAITAFLSDDASNYEFAAIGVMGHASSSAFDDFGTVTTKVGAGNGPIGYAALGSAVSAVAGDFSGANVDSQFSSVDVATGLTTGGAFHANVTNGAVANNSYSIMGGLDDFIEFVWTRVDPSNGNTFPVTLGFWSVNSSTGEIAFSTSTTVVPVPAAIWLLGSGLMGLVGVSRRRKV